MRFFFLRMNNKILLGVYGNQAKKTRNLDDFHINQRHPISRELGTAPVDILRVFARHVVTAYEVIAVNQQVPVSQSVSQSTEMI